MWESYHIFCIIQPLWSDKTDDHRIHQESEENSDRKAANFSYNLAQEQGGPHQPVSNQVIYIVDTIQDFFSNFRIKWQLNWVKNSIFP